MKILHVASFDGNIGDIANHTGFYTSFRKYIDAQCRFDQLEMRQFYKSWGIRKFDEKFASQANQYDLVVFGGGGFFRMHWDYSYTGTTIDINDEVLSLIKKPMLFNGMGVSDGGEAVESAILKFGNFLNKIISLEKCFVSIRNDGSSDIIKKHFGSETCKDISVVPDGGYFIIPSIRKHPEIVSGKTNIAICLGGDMPDVKFNEKEGHISRVKFTKKFAEYCTTLLESNDNYRIIFAPHIPNDIEFIGEILTAIPDIYKRQRITVAALLNGLATDGMVTYDLYKNCDLVLGMRHHANVCSIGMNIPTIGIVTNESHKKDFDEIGLPHRCIFVNRDGFEKVLLEKTQEALQNPATLKEENREVLARVTESNEAYFTRLAKWLKLHHQQ